MRDEDKTKEQLIDELMEMRRQIDASESEWKRLEEKRGMKIGEILIEMSYLTGPQLERYLQKQNAETLSRISRMYERKRRRIGEILIESNIITEEELYSGLAEQQKRFRGQGK